MFLYFFKLISNIIKIFSHLNDVRYNYNIKKWRNIMCTVNKHHSWIIYPLLANYEQSVDSIKKATYLNHKNKTS